jgi:hypothetical protein
MVNGSWIASLATSDNSGSVAGVPVVNITCSRNYVDGVRCRGCYGAYDNNYNEGLWVIPGSFSGDWNQIQLASGIHPTMFRIKDRIDYITCEPVGPGTRIGTFSLQVSNDGSNWTTLGSYFHGVMGWKEFSVVY